MDADPVIIIGAPRSGTNMLRDTLTSMSGLATWPCDEINYIWRHGNVRHPSDEFSPEQANSRIKQYIRAQFDWVSRRYGADVVVEKTCANSLRVPFVHEVIPEARYIFIRRNGLDVVGSAMARWKGALDIPYLARKARFVPAADLPYYAIRFIGSRLHRLVSSEGRIGLWGPQLDNMDRLLAEHPLDEVCALQWKSCVDSASNAFANLPEDCWLEVAYEDFVGSPEAGLSRILQFIGLGVDTERCRAAVAGVRGNSVGKGRRKIGQDATNRLWPLIGDTMSRLGYVE